MGGACSGTVASIADEAMVDEADVWAMIRERAVIHDTSGSYARRVLDASRRRQMMAVALDVYNALGEGGALAEAVAVLDSVGGDVRDGISSATGSGTGSDHVSHRPEPVRRDSNSAVSMRYLRRSEARKAGAFLPLVL